jgi:hypothetical protein
MNPATTPVIATSAAGPHLPPRDWVQEFGDTIHARAGGYMHYFYGGERFSRVVRVPERSYMASTVAIMTADGRLTEAAARDFYAYMWG